MSKALHRPPPSKQGKALTMIGCAAFSLLMSLKQILEIDSRLPVQINFEIFHSSAATNVYVTFITTSIPSMRFFRTVKTVQVPFEKVLN